MNKKLNVSWNDFKSFLTSGNAHIKHIDDGKNFHIFLYDGGFEAECLIDKTSSDGIDYSTNYISNSNVPFKEKATTHEAKGKADVVNQIATVDILIPSEGRIVSNGRGWFDISRHVEDYVKVSVIHPIAGEVGQYYDPNVNVLNQGSWFDKDGYVRIKSITDPAFIPGGLSIRIEAFTGDIRVDTFRCNVSLGKRLI